MKKSALWTVVIIVVLILLAGGAYAALHKSSTTSSSTATSTNPGGSSSNNQQTSPSPSPSSSNTSNAVIQTKTASNVGSYLANANGMALYTYGADTAGKSNCSGSCLSAWPIYTAANAPASLPANVTVITRTDGTKQYTYKTMPLYTFTGDSSGTVTGNNVANFHVAKP